MAFELPIIAFRHAPWGGNSGLADLARAIDDWSGATFAWAFSTTPGAAASLTLVNAAPGSQGISATYDAGYIHPTNGSVIGATTIRPQMDEATLEGFPSPINPADDIEMYHTLYVTPSGGVKQVLCFGTFTIKQGVPN